MEPETEEQEGGIGEWEAPTAPQPSAPEPSEEPEAGTPTPVWDPLTGTWQTQIDTGPVFRPPREPRRTPPGIRAGVVGGIVGALLASAVSIAVVRETVPRVSGGVVVERQLSPGAQATVERGGVVDIAAKARPWVVNINVTGQEPGFFGFGQTFQGIGSGVILRSDGSIVTNAHVVQNAQQVEVTLASGAKLPARVVGIDTDTDVAVVKVNRNGLPPALVGTAKDLKVGELAVAIGSPLGLQQTVTAGIVSALGRAVDRDNQPPLVDMIQTDAPITHGNSGGALIDAHGALVGINTAIASSSGGAEGIAFAIPIDIAKAVAEQLISSGKATHPWLGIQGANVDPETAQKFGISEGALVAQVVPGGPADKAGIKPQDIIVSLNGDKVASMDELIVAIRQHDVGATLRVEIVRDGKHQTVDLTLGDRPSRLS